ncbi:MAG TPA: hypothetical protein DIU00_18630 [Phycisphaerales bacterium]|nr:hypothetical protein [Phycisphaerales bacterium]
MGPLIVAGLRYWFVRLSLIYLFVGITGRAEARLELLDEPKNQPFLLLTCSFTKWTFEALFRFGTVFLVNFFGLHNLLLSKRNPAMSFRQTLPNYLFAKGQN